MINFRQATGIKKMLRFLAIFVYCFLAVKADGSFYVLNTPESLAFQRLPVTLPSEQVGDVIRAAKGYGVSDSADFPGLLIKDPFAFPQKAVIVEVIGLKELPLNDDNVRYTVEGKSVSSSLDDLMLTWAQAQGLCDITLTNTNELRDCVNVHVKSNKEIVFGKINVSKLVKADVENTKLRLVKSLNSIQELTENESDKSLLFIVIAHDDNILRKKRDALLGTKTNTYNLAAYYDQNYPVIFNIILWFMVALGLSLLAVCYAIADMDPGRDSIIYRMTSTRMKKDN
ncbi:ATPase H(+)-transporting accessory protein 2 [Eurosta solidaginis]|uniref:ATPase H(+)-transporting accessory protein 2 n=1 Tax=Eurosta solidaginis TaxID=178769 RepID=UPI0035316C7C